MVYIHYVSLCKVQSACRGLNQKGMRENGWQVASLSRYVVLSLILQKLQPSSLWMYNPLTGGKHIFWSPLCSDSTYPLLLYKTHLPLLCYAWKDRWSWDSAWCLLSPVPCACVKENVSYRCVCDNDNKREGRSWKIEIYHRRDRIILSVRIYSAFLLSYDINKGKVYPRIGHENPERE